jgi:hypothetical protein
VCIVTKEGGQKTRTAENLVLRRRKKEEGRRQRKEFILMFTHGGDQLAEGFYG